MLEPIIDDLNRLFKTFETVIIAIVVGCLMLWVGRCTAAKDAVVKERVKVLTNTIRVQVPVYVHDTVTAYRTRTRYDSLRLTDTVTRNDTVFVARAEADTAIRACTQALHDCEHIRALNDSLTTQLGKQKKHWTDRIGLSVGPSVVATKDGTVVWGVGAVLGIKVWP